MAKSLPVDSYDQAQGPKPPEPRIPRCKANGCPLPGTIKNESKEQLCAAHFGANPDGWPKSTAVLVRYADLWFYAREAGSSTEPESSNELLARQLMRTAKSAGLKFTKLNKEKFDGEPMKLKTAGLIVEAAINAIAIEASGKIEARGDDQTPQDIREKNFADRLAQLAGKFAA